MNTNHLSHSQFKNLLFQYDVNKDGRISKEDLQIVQQWEKQDLCKQFSSGPFGAFQTPQKTKNSELRKEIESLLETSQDSSIDFYDIKKNSFENQSCNNRCVPNENLVSKESSKFATSCTTPSVKNRSKQELKEQIQRLQKAKEADLANPLGAWKSDDMARELVNNNPRLLDQASLEEKSYLLCCLRDSGTSFASINQEDRQAMQKILQSCAPQERDKLLQMAGGKEHYTCMLPNLGMGVSDLKKGFDDFFLVLGPKRFFGPSPTETNQPSHPLSSNGSTSSSGGGVNSSSETSPASETNDGSYNATFPDLYKKSKGVANLMKQYQNETDPEVKKDLGLKLQKEMQEESQMFSLFTNLMKMHHDTMKGIIGNLR